MAARRLMLALTVACATALSACSVQPAPTAEEAEVVARLNKRFDAGDYEGAADAVQVLATRWPGSRFVFSTPLDVVALDVALGGLSATRPDAQFALERYLDASGWDVSRAWEEIDDVWLRLAVKLWEAGDHAGAERVLLKTQSATVLAGVRADRRFDAIVAAHPEHFDVEKVHARTLAHLKATAWLQHSKGAATPLLNRADLLKQQGDYPEALKLVEEARGRDPDQASREDSAVALSSLALDLGHVDKAYQIINDQLLDIEHSQYPLLWRAEVELARDQPLKALLNIANMIDDHVERLPRVDRMRPLFLETCAAAQLGKPLVVARVLNTLDAHADFSPLNTLDAHLCAGDMDGAAAVALHYLRAPDRRHVILIALQDWATPPWRPAWRMELDARRQRLRQRPDVAAEIDRVGRINRYPLQNTSPIS